MKLKQRGTLLLVGWLLAGNLAAHSPTTPKTELPRQYAVASAHPLATQAGLDILAAGGNAFDAAVTVASVLGVVEPYSAGIGGGGFWLLHHAKNGKTLMLDARETAPGAAHRDMYLDKDGAVDRQLATNSALSAGIPGQAAAMAHLAEHYGRLPLPTTLAAAIKLAEDGFNINPVYEQLAAYRRDTLNSYPTSRAIFLLNGKPLHNNSLIVQQDLAKTLKRLASQGFAGFYQGQTAKDLVTGVQDAGGIWTLKDLAEYRVIERQPIRFSYGEATIWSAPPPSSGGVALAQMFGLLEPYLLEQLSEADRTHLLVEVMRRAYHDRAQYLGDQDFVDVPIARLTSSQHLKKLGSDINLKQATASSSLGQPWQADSGTHTTHFSVIDQLGNRVSATLSINLPFGSGFTVPGTGVLLNNEMDDFSAKPGSPNAYGLIGNEANAIAPGKRPLSSMSPTFMEYGSQQNPQLAIIGTPGGSRIISMVFLGLLEALDGKPPQAWVDRPRFHHQYLPDVIQHEPEALGTELMAQLKKKGHQLKSTNRHYGDMHVIHWAMDSGEVSGASDRRRLGSAQVGQ